MKEAGKGTGMQVIVQIPAKDKSFWEPIVDTAQNLCKKAGFFCGVTIGWKEVWVFGKESTVFVTIATTSHHANKKDKNLLMEAAEIINDLARSVRPLAVS